MKCNEFCRDDCAACGYPGTDFDYIGCTEDCPEDCMADHQGET